MFKLEFEHHSTRRISISAGDKLSKQLYALIQGDCMLLCRALIPTTLEGAIQTLVCVKGTTWSCAVHNVGSHIWWPCSNSSKVIKYSKFQLSFELYYSKHHFKVVSSYNMSICIMRICSRPDIPEKGLEGSPAV